MTPQLQTHLTIVGCSTIDFVDSLQPSIRFHLGRFIVVSCWTRIIVVVIIATKCKASAKVVVIVVVRIVPNMIHGFLGSFGGLVCSFLHPCSAKLTTLGSFALGVLTGQISKLFAVS